MNTHRLVDGYKYFVFGTGRVGRAVIYDLAKYCTPQLITAYDTNIGTAVYAEKELRKLLGRQYIPISFYPTIGNVRLAELSNYDVIISCAPYSENEEITQAAIASKTPMIDLGGNQAIVSAQEEMAHGQQTLIVPECGISPGISNMIAAHLANEGYSEIKIYCGGIPSIKPTNLLVHKNLFSTQGLVSEYLGELPTIKNSKLEYVPALDSVENYEGWEASPTSNNSTQSIRTLLKLGVNEYSYKTLRWPGHWAACKHIMDQCTDPVTNKLDSELLIQRINSITDIQYTRGIDTDMLLLHVHAKHPGYFRTDYSIKICIKADKHTKFSAMELATAWGATMVACSVASKKKTHTLPKGFCTPELVVNYDYLKHSIEYRMARIENGEY
jgi:hypothetical protein